MVLIQSIEKRLNRSFGQLIVEKNLIEENDKILVGLSGGKDSWTLCYFLHKFQQKAPVKFDIQVVTLDYNFSCEEKQSLQKKMRELKIPYSIEENDILETVKNKRREGSSFCSLCARFRRAHLYKIAEKYACNKLALGHHLDDFIETYFLNILFHGKTKGMPAKLKADNNKHVLIRPMLYCYEKDILAFSKFKEFPIINCGCAEQQINNSQRAYLKEIISKIEADYPGTKQSILTAAKNVVAEHIF